MSVNTKMKAIADEIRTLSGTTETMSLDAMATNVGAANDEVDSQTELLAQAVAALEGKAGGGSEPSLQSKSVTPSAVQQTVVPDSGYDGLSNVTVNAIPSTYVKPTATKAATTYTPTTSNQTIAAGTYCSGAQTIKGDANLVAGNIKSGVSIFDVVGSYEGSGGGGTGGSAEARVVTGKIYDSGEFDADSTISVTGLGFRPQHVMVCRAISQNMQGTESFHLLMAQAGKTYNEIVAKKAPKNGSLQPYVYHYSSPEYVKIGITDDGFTITTLQTVTLRSLQYVAVG